MEANETPRARKRGEDVHEPGGRVHVDDETDRNDDDGWVEGVVTGGWG